MNLHAVSVSRILKAEKEKRLKKHHPDRIKLFSQAGEIEGGNIHILKTNKNNW